MSLETSPDSPNPYSELDKRIPIDNPDGVDIDLSNLNITYNNGLYDALLRITNKCKSKVNSLNLSNNDIYNEGFELLLDRLDHVSSIREFFPDVILWAGTKLILRNCNISIVNGDKLYYDILRFLRNGYRSIDLRDNNIMIPPINKDNYYGPLRQLEWDCKHLQTQSQLRSNRYYTLGELAQGETISLYPNQYSNPYRNPYANPYPNPYESSYRNQQKKRSDGSITLGELAQGENIYLYK
jgi:hypothetical protein